MPSVFDQKSFNSEVFAYAVGRVENTKRKEMIRSKAVRNRSDLADAMKEQNGAAVITTALTGTISGTVAQNYDGQTNITSGKVATFNHTRVVVGRSAAWTEKDFSHDVTGGKDFIDEIAEQVSEYLEEVDQDTLIAILSGVFNMSGVAANEEFVEKHTHDVTAVQNSEGQMGMMDATTMNTGMQKACGDNKGKFSLAIMHSSVATHLENLKILVYAKYNDENGLERDVAIGTVNGRLVLIDDGMPNEDYFVKTADEELVEGKTYYKIQNGEYKPVATPSAAQLNSYYELAGHAYTTFVLGDGAIEYTDCGAKVPYEAARDPKTNGGEDTLIVRQRHCFSPFGISFTSASMASLSPTNAELANGANWSLDSTADQNNKQYVEHKSIPIARIISLG